MFAGATAHIRADGVGREVLRCAMQPAGQEGAVRKLLNVPQQHYERRVRHVLGEVRIANHPQRGGINRVNVPPHEFGECPLRPASGVIAQKLLIG
jgi:hypothetical protein